MSLTLAFDATGGRLAVGLFDDAAKLAERVEIRDRGHAERLFPMIDTVMTEAGAALPSLDLIAVCTGPGNFTGARIGVAAARGLALSCEARAIGVDRFEALAEGVRGRGTIALTARGGALHVALFADGVITGMPETVQAEELSSFATDGLVLGDGAAALIAAAGRGKTGDPTGDAPLSALAAIAVRRAAEGVTKRPAPRYLRPVNAALPREAPPRII
ncbi:MAG: tRNA (adenosine(37)-N6)-threonylcarbamoyltransferase complex dimerization subunit type 1 TsaB [Pseudomonadota bacterium]